MVTGNLSQAAAQHIVPRLDHLEDCLRDDHGTISNWQPAIVFRATRTCLALRPLIVALSVEHDIGYLLEAMDAGKRMATCSDHVPVLARVLPVWLGLNTQTRNINGNALNPCLQRHTYDLGNVTCRLVLGKDYFRSSRVSPSTEFLENLSSGASDVRFELEPLPPLDGFFFFFFLVEVHWALGSLILADAQPKRPIAIKIPPRQKTSIARSEPPIGINPRVLKELSPMPSMVNFP